MNDFLSSLLSGVSDSTSRGGIPDTLLNSFLATATQHNGPTNRLNTTARPTATSTDPAGTLLALLSNQMNGGSSGTRSGASGETASGLPLSLLTTMMSQIGSASSRGGERSSDSSDMTRAAVLATAVPVVASLATQLITSAMNNTDDESEENESRAATATTGATYDPFEGAEENNSRGVIAVPERLRDASVGEVVQILHNAREAWGLEEEVDQDTVARCFCPITQCLMCDPVRAADGNTYERSAIENWLRVRRTSPLTNLPIDSLRVERDEDTRLLIGQILSVLYL